MEQQNVDDLIKWAAEISEKVERTTNNALSVTRVLALHGIETNKLESKCKSRVEAIEKAKVIVANALLNK